MITAIVAILIGFAGLTWSADRFVAGAASIARNLGMTPIMIGLTIVALGTSAPEVIVSISASLDNAPNLAVGNAIGSNLANIGLVLGVTALISPIPIAGTQLRRELPLLILATLGAGVLVANNHLGRMDGVILLLALAIIFSYLVKSKSHQSDAAEQADVEHLPDFSAAKAWGWFLLGLTLLIASSYLLVWGAKIVASSLGVSELVIGLTVVAVGTSLPELATTVASALKGHHDIALGNVIGSNLFNLLAVMAMPALINPPQLEAVVFERDYLAMTAITLLLAAILYGHYLWRYVSKGQQQHTMVIGRFAGTLLLLVYGGYYYWLL